MYAKVNTDNTYFLSGKGTQGSARAANALIPMILYTVRLDFLFLIACHLPRLGY